MVTRADFYDHIKICGCDCEPFEGGNRTAHAVEITNPNKPGSQTVYLDLPIDETPMGHYNAYNSCLRLQIDMIKECEYMKDAHDHIEKNHNPKTKK